jgi:uracil-DNA glycosylase family 4
VNEAPDHTDDGLTPTASLEAVTPAGVARFLRQRIEFGEDRVLLAEAGTRGVLDSLVRFRSRPAEPPALGAVKRTPAVTSLVAAGRPPAALEPMAPPVPAADLSLPGTLDEVEKVCAGCVRCGLAQSRTQTVFADGNPDARVMVVGEAPGANEDATGQPFVGAAGKFLDLLLRTVGLSRRDSVYICNVIKCRPPGNRNPERIEIESCAPYLRRQIELVRPEVILAVGTFSGQLLTGVDDTLGRLRGRVFRYEGIPLVVTYHPAALLRNSGWTRPTWEDFQLLRRILDGEDVPT